MKNPSLSRRIYNSSLTLALSFSFYTLIFLYTLSCEGEEAALPLQSFSEEVTQQETPADSTIADLSVSYVEEIIK